MSDGYILEVSGRNVEVTNIGKVFWPMEGYTKGDLLNYYAGIAPILLPYLYDRPLVMQRWPDGIKGKSFYQKQCPAYAPEWMHTVSFKSEESGKITNYCTVEDTAGLLWLINQGSIELHPWLSTVMQPDYPLEMVIDLDPNPPAGFKEALYAALLIKEVLDSYGLRGYAKTSGATGLHIYIPLEPVYSYDQVRQGALKILQPVAEAYPDGVTLERRVEERGGRVYLDYLQNVKGKTIASVYSVRPLPGAPVSTPLTWEEIMTGHIMSQEYNMMNLKKRITIYGDLFEPVLNDRQRIDTIMQ